jgi:hypothetical protein
MAPLLKVECGLLHQLEQGIEQFEQLIEAEMKTHQDDQESQTNQRDRFEIGDTDLRGDECPTPINVAHQKQKSG